MQKKLLSLIIITAITYSCSKGLSPKDDVNKVNAETQTELKKTNQKGQTEIARKTIYFDTNSFTIDETKNESLKNQILPLINSDSKIAIIVEGHCDERGSSLFNNRLGKKRANAIKKFLVKSGIKSSKILAISYGENKPVDLGHNEDAWSKNRRVEIVLFK